LLGANLVFWAMSPSRIASVCYLVGTILFGLFVWWLNQRANRIHLQPMLDEIDGVIRQLTSEEPQPHLTEARPMATEQTNHTNQRANPNPTPRTTGPRASWGRSIALATALVFFISSAFPVVAGLSKNTAAFPKWWGVLDVSIAFFLAILVLVVMALAQGKVNRQAVDASYRTYRILTHGIFAMLVVFFLAGDRVVWPNCLTGFAWRTWLLLYSLPAWFTALGASAGRGEPFPSASRPQGALDNANS